MRATLISLTRETADEAENIGVKIYEFDDELFAELGEFLASRARAEQWPMPASKPLAGVESRVGWMSLTMDCGQPCSCG